MPGWSRPFADQGAHESSIVAQVAKWHAARSSDRVHALQSPAAGKGGERALDRSLEATASATSLNRRLAEEILESGKRGLHEGGLGALWPRRLAIVAG
jgi:hypothetical protein